MANGFPKEVQVMFEDVLVGFEDSLVASKNVKQYSPDSQGMQRSGDTFWRPQPFYPEVVDGLDITGQESDLEQLVVPATLSSIKSVYKTFDALELRDKSQRDRLSLDAGKMLASQVNQSIENLVANTGSVVATTANGPTGYDDFALADTLLTEIGVPMDGNRSAFVHSRDYNSMAGNLANRETDNSRDHNAYSRALIGSDIAGFKAFKSDTMPRLQAAAGGAITVSGAQEYTPMAQKTQPDGSKTNVDNRYMDLTVSATAGVVVGDRFTIAGVVSVHQVTKVGTGQLKTFVVVEVIDGTTLKIAAPIIATGEYKNVTTAAADGAAITWLNTNAGFANVFWHDDSVEVLRGNLAVDDFTGSMDIMRGTTENGIEIVMAKQGDIGSFAGKYRFSVFYGTVNLCPEMNGIQLFNQ